MDADPTSKTLLHVTSIKQLVREAERLLGDADELLNRYDEEANDQFAGDLDELIVACTAVADRAADRSGPESTELQTSAKTLNLVRLALSSGDLSRVRELIEEGIETLNQARWMSEGPDRNERAFCELYVPRCLRWLERFGLGGIPDEDKVGIAHDVVISFIRKLPTFDRGDRVGSVRRYLRVATHGLAVDYVRRHKDWHEVRLQDPDDFSAASVEDTDGPLNNQGRYRAAIVLLDDEIQAAKAALFSLSDEPESTEKRRARNRLLRVEQKRVIFERRLKGDSSKDIAEDLGISANTEQNRWMRLKDKLKRELWDDPPTECDGPSM